MKEFYEKIEKQKKEQLIKDRESRQHHDTMLVKSPIPLNRYDDNDHLPTKVVKPAQPSYKMIARALFNFQAQNQRELGFKKGDVIYVKRQIDANWYEGERNAMIGIFPVTYVEIIPENEIGTLGSTWRSRGGTGTTTPRAGSAASGPILNVQEGQAKAKFNFQAQTPMELTLVKGEVVTLIRRIDRNWYEGRIGSRKGIFPASYIDVLVEPGETRGMSPKPMATPAAHGMVKNGGLPQTNYTPPNLNINPYEATNVSY